MTSSFGADNELGCVNWFKFLHTYICPKVYFDIGDQKLSQSLLEIPIRHKLKGDNSSIIRL